MNQKEIALVAKLDNIRKPIQLYKESEFSIYISESLTQAKIAQ